MKPVPNDVTRCEVQCELAPECQRAAPVSEDAGGFTPFAHFIGGRQCPGYLPYQACFSCARWERQTPPPGSQPGVAPDYRPCGRVRLSGERTEWRAPTDWCDQWTPR